MYSGNFADKCVRSSSASYICVKHGIALYSRVGVIGHQPLLARHVIARQHHSLAYSRILSQPCLNLAYFNSKTANLDLIIIPAGNFNPPISQPAPRSPVLYIRLPASSWAFPYGFGQKPLRCQLWPVPIPSRHSRSTDIQLSDYACRHRLSISIQNVYLCVCYWLPNGRIIAGRFSHSPARLRIYLLSVGP